MNILLVEDEENVSSFVKQGLEEEAYHVTVAKRGDEAWQYIENNDFDLIILDVMLPDISGYNLCQRIRNEFDYTFKIIMLTALNTTDHVVEGLNAGADDYLGKPFAFKELIARVDALARRNSSSAKKNIYKYLDLEVNDDTKSVQRAGNKVELTPKEYNLLVFMLQNKEKVIKRQELLENVWEVDFDLGTNVVDVYVNYLRNKVDKGFMQKLIHTVKGMGYCLRLDKHEHKT